ERTRSRPLVAERNPANLRVILRRHRHVKMTFDPQSAAAEFGAVGAEGCRIAGIFHGQGLMRRGPEHTGLFIAKIKEGSPMVAGGVRTPARDVELAPTAVARACVGDHQCIPAIAEQMNSWNR